MPELLRVKAIVTRAVPYNESDMIVTLVCVEKGRLTATAKGCLKPRAKLRYAAEPMNFGDYMLAPVRGERYIIADCEQIDSFSALTRDIEKYYAASLILDTLQKASPEPNPDLFTASVRALGDMAYGDAAACDVVKGFLLSLLDLNGYPMDFKHCAVCRCDLDGACAFSPSDGIVCRHCARLDSITIDEITRGVLCGDISDAPEPLKTKANIALSELVYHLLGIKIGTHYFTERL